jgi:hypothetical protein
MSERPSQNKPFTETTYLDENCQILPTPIEKQLALNQVGFKFSEEDFLDVINALEDRLVELEKELSKASYQIDYVDKDITDFKRKMTTKLRVDLEEFLTQLGSDNICLTLIMRQLKLAIDDFKSNLTTYNSFYELGSIRQIRAKPYEEKYSEIRWELIPEVKKEIEFHMRNNPTYRNHPALKSNSRRD